MVVAIRCVIHVWINGRSSGENRTLSSYVARLLSSIGRMVLPFGGV